MAYEDIIESASKAYQIPVEVIKAIIRVESNWDPNAKRYESHLNDSSLGLMQLLTKTAKYVANNTALTAEQILQPTLNILLGTKYLKEQLNKYDNLNDAIAAYNAGSPRKTSTGAYVNQGYVDKVNQWIKVYTYLPLTPTYLPFFLMVGGLIYYSWKGEVDWWPEDVYGKRKKKRTT